MLTPKDQPHRDGVRRPSLRDVRDLGHLYRLAEDDTAELMDLARQAQQPGWWTGYDDTTLSPYIGFEQEAVSITVFSMSVVPALLQTEDYARASIGAKARRIAPAMLEQRVQALRRRQELLDQQSRPRYRALLDEAVLHRQVGGPSIMADQLDKIVQLSQNDLAIVQIVPFTAGAHGITDSNFDFFEFGSGQLHPVVYVEGFSSTLYMERSSDTEKYRQAIEDLRDVALIPGESLKVIDEVRKMHANQ